MLLIRVLVMCSVLALALVAGVVAVAAGVFTGHGESAATSRNGPGTSIVAGMLGAAMGGGATNADHAKKMVEELSAASDETRRAERSGDSAAEMDAGLKAIGAIVHAGAAPVPPIAHDRLKTLLPGSVAGLARTAADGSSGSFAGISASSAHATYGKAGSGTIDVTVADLSNMGGVAVAANLATTMNIKTDGDDGYEKNIDVDGHRVHVKWTNDVRRSDVTEIVDNRYAISVDGTGVAMDAAIRALRAVDMTKFQALGTTR